MTLTAKTPNDPVEITVLRPFRFRNADGKMDKIHPAKKGKPKTVNLPYQFAREMEAAQKVTFEIKGAVDIDLADEK